MQLNQIPQNPLDPLPRHFNEDIPIGQFEWSFSLPEALDMLPVYVLEVNVVVVMEPAGRDHDMIND